MQRWRDIGIGACLVVLAAWLRRPALDNPSLWVDDAWVAVVHRAEWSDIPTIGVTAPGYAAFMRVWFTLVGFTETTAQLPAFVAGIASPAIALWILRPRIRWWIASLAGLAIAVAPIHVTYSGRVKQYALEVLVGLGLLWLTLRTLEDPGDRRRFTQLCAAASLAVLFSYSLTTLVAGCVTAAFFAAVRIDRTDVLRLAAWAALPATVAIALLPFIRSRSNEALRNYWSDRYAVRGQGLPTFLGSVVDRVESVTGGFTRLAVPLAIVIVLGSLTALVVRRPLHFLAVGTPLVSALVLASLEITPLGGGRTDLYLMAPLLIGSAIGADLAISDLSTLVGRGGRTVTVGASVGFGVLVLATGVWSVRGMQQARYPQEHVRELVEIVDAQRQPNESLVLYPAGRFGYALYGDVEPIVVDDPTLTPYTVAFDDPSIVVTRMNRADPTRYLPYLVEAAEKGDRVWLLGMHLRRDFDAMVELAQEELGMRIVDRWKTSKSELVLFEPGDPGISKETS